MIGYERVKKVRKSLRSSLLALAALLFMPFAQAEDAVFLSQYSKQYGEQIFLISKIGCRIECKSHDYVIVAKPPDWNITVFNPKQSVYAQVPLKKWQGPYLATMQKYYATRFSYLVKNDTEPGTLQKLAVTRVHFKIENVSGKIKEQLAQRAYLTVTNDLPASIPLQEVVYQYYSIPSAPGFPLAFEWMDKDLDWQRYVILHNWRKGKCSQKDFEIPAKAKRVKSSLEVIVKPLQEGMFETFFGSTKK